MRLGTRVSLPGGSALAAPEVCYGQSKQDLGFCLGRRRHSDGEPAYCNCSRVKEPRRLEGCFRVRKTQSCGARSHECVTRRLGGAAVAEVDAHSAECVDVPVGGEAGDLHVGESSRSFGCQHRRCGDPLQCGWQLRGLGDHHLYIGRLPLADLARPGEHPAGQRSGMTPERSAQAVVRRLRGSRRRLAG